MHVLALVSAEAWPERIVLEMRETNMNRLYARDGLTVGALACAAVLYAAAGTGLLVAQDSKGAKAEPPPIAATIDGDPVYVGEIEAVLFGLQKSRKVSPQSVNFVMAELLNQCINRRLAEKAIRKDETYVKQADIDKEIDKIKTQASSMRMTLDELVAKRRISVDTLRHEVAWNIGWEKYLELKLGEALEDYFNRHRKELDGTQVRASHILLRTERFNEAPKQLIARAAEIREEIESGKVTFEQAAEKYSAGPSRHKKGDLGFFPRYGVMHEDFTKAAFALNTGELGKPVVSPFGVHLIKVTEVKPGSKQWTEAAAQLKNPTSTDLFEKLVAEERKTAKVEFTGKLPYFKPGTRQLMMPGVEPR
jgi:parvulin-like peptidyl-prolyl isomerase